MGNEPMKAKLCATVIGGKGYGIRHSWDGSVLTVSSDSGSSSADLMGPRGPAGGELFVAEIRLDGEEYVCDKSFEEVKKHIDLGDMVVCEFVGYDSRGRGQLTICTDYSATFVLQSVFGADEYFTLTAEGVTHMAAENEEETPSRVEVVKTDNTVTVTAVYGFSERVTAIELNDSGDPVLVVQEGKEIALEWSGFDD